MSEVVKVSEAASLGLHTMVLLADERGTPLSTREIANRLGVSESHLSKVLQRLVHAGLLQSVRGPGGGFTLAGRKGDATLLEVYEAIDGPMSGSRCLLGSPACAGDDCILGGALEDANKRIRDHLAGTRLSELTHVYGGNNGG